MLPETMVLETRKGPIEFTTSLTDDEVARRLEKLPDNFGRDLAAKRIRYGWSASQRKWAHYIAWKAENGAPEPPTVITAGLGAIVALFELAEKKLKHPKIHFEINGRGLDLALAGKKSRSPGSVNVTDGRRYPSNTWYGRIDRDGTTTIGQTWVVEFLRRFAADPAGVAKAYGLKMGRCCFCNLELKDARSTDVGYGPKCAEAFGMPWGSRKPTAAETCQHESRSEPAEAAGEQLELMPDGIPF